LFLAGTLASGALAGSIAGGACRPVRGIIGGRCCASLQAGGRAKEQPQDSKGVNDPQHLFHAIHNELLQEDQQL
jgi:hypothetical protein